MQLSPLEKLMNNADSHGNRRTEFLAVWVGWTFTLTVSGLSVGSGKVKILSLMTYSEFGLAS